MLKELNELMENLNVVIVEHDTIVQTIWRVIGKSASQQKKVKVSNKLWNILTNYCSASGL